MTQTNSVAGTLLASPDGSTYFIPDVELARFRLAEPDADAAGEALGDEVEGYSLLTGSGSLAFPCDAHPMAMPIDGGRMSDPGPALPMEMPAPTYRSFSLRPPR